MPTEIGQGILGTSPDWLNFGALGLLGIAIIVVAAVVFSGARSKAQFRLALLFMAFTLIIAGLAIGAELYRGNEDAQRLNGELDSAKVKVAEVETERDAAVTKLEGAEAAMNQMTSVVTAEIGKIANSLDAKWCVEIRQMDNRLLIQSLAVFVTQMRNSVKSIQAELSVADEPPQIPFECIEMANP